MPKNKYLVQMVSLKKEKYLLYFCIKDLMRLSLRHLFTFEFDGPVLDVMGFSF